METVNVNIRLRPIRFGFLVNPNEKTALSNIFEVNTCLWGGRYNPIIPCFHQVPRWWDRSGTKFENASQIMNGYLDFFEPDYLVESEPGLATALSFEQTRVVPLSDLLRRSADSYHRGVGTDVLDLYRSLYRQEFQFVRRHRHGVMDVAARQPFDAFAACLFGAFPRDPKLVYFHEGFETAFDPDKIALDAATLQATYEALGGPDHRASALMIGSAHLRVDYDGRGEPTLFILDAAQPKDLLDFWNLRVAYPNIQPIPLQWLPQMSAYCREFIKRGHHPLPGNPNGVMTRVTCLFSRSIPDADIQPLFAAHLQTDVADANVLQDWYPPLWRPTPEFVFRRTRPQVEAGRRAAEAPIDDSSYIRFDTIAPEFADHFGGEHRWANVIQMKQWGGPRQVATVFPTDVRLEAPAGLQIGGGPLVSTTEGLVTFPHFKDIPHSWHLVDGAASIARWLDRAGVRATPSEAGKATNQIIQTLEGLSGVGTIAHPGVVRLLDQMARTPITHSAHQKEFENRVKSAVAGDLWRQRTFESLVEHNVVELGYELKCSKCGSWSWHELTKLGPQVTCHLCLRSFDFPRKDPAGSQHGRWAYRVIGPFALPDYAGGGYATALAMRFFGEVLGSPSGPEITWAAGQELTFSNGQASEVDFALWYQRKEIARCDYPTEILFGEAKSFGKDTFEDRDVARMRGLAERLPGALFVFATMRDGADLSTDEIKRIRRFAEWGRQNDRSRRRSRAPVIVLTGTELFAAHHLEQAWKDKGGRHAQLAEPAWVTPEHLATMADLTQQLYLGMPSYSAWHQQKWAARRKRTEAALAEKS